MPVRSHALHMVRGENFCRPEILSRRCEVSLRIASDFLPGRDYAELIVTVLWDQPLRARECAEGSIYFLSGFLSFDLTPPSLYSSRTIVMYSLSVTQRSVSRSVDSVAMTCLI